MITFFTFTDVTILLFTEYTIGGGFITFGTPVILIREAFLLSITLVSLLAFAFIGSGGILTVCQLMTGSRSGAFVDI